MDDLKSRGSIREPQSAAAFVRDPPAVARKQHSMPNCRRDFTPMIDGRANRPGEPWSAAARQRRLAIPIGKISSDDGIKPLLQLSFFVTDKMRNAAAATSIMSLEPNVPSCR